MKKKTAPSFSDIKKLLREGLNVYRTARKLGCTKEEIMKVIRKSDANP